MHELSSLDCPFGSLCSSEVIWFDTFTELYHYRCAYHFDVQLECLREHEHYITGRTFEELIEELEKRCFLISMPCSALVNLRLYTREHISKLILTMLPLLKKSPVILQNLVDDQGMPTLTESTSLRSQQAIVETAIACRYFKQATLIFMNGDLNQITKVAQVQVTKLSLPLWLLELWIIFQPVNLESYHIRFVNYKVTLTYPKGVLVAADLRLLEVNSVLLYEFREIIP